MANEADKFLKGSPPKILVKRVRSCLNRYGMKPTSTGIDGRPLWPKAWVWAYEVSSTYAAIKRHWPSANEIAMQYVFLVLQTMQATCMRLPYRSWDVKPEVLQMLGVDPKVMHNLGKRQPLLLESIRGEESNQVPEAEVVASEPADES